MGAIAEKEGLVSADGARRNRNKTKNKKKKKMSAEDYAGSLLKQAIRGASKRCRHFLGMMMTEESGCTIVNKTDKEVVVRAKYRDVWEGELWRLPGHGGQMVVPRRFLPQEGEPYNRLGAFVDSGLPFSSSPLLIPSADLIRHRCLAISLAIPHCTVPGFPALDIAPTISV